MYPGDPTTPGYPSYENSTRTKGENIPDIPSLPLSWTNAKILFRTLNGSDPLYGKRVRLVNNGESTGCLVFSFEWVLKRVSAANTTVTPIWNTLAVIPGHITDEVVVIGNHRDGMYIFQIVTIIP
jgi:N-acetylated-alpha-linked acidic dipeptidase